MDQNSNRKREQGDDSDLPNRSSNMEKAEGSRETAESNATGNAGGVTNRPLDREQREQMKVPERGHRKSEDSGGSES